MLKFLKFPIALLLATACLAASAQPLAEADTARLEQRALHLAEQLRCVVCQNQTLADSHAELAQDLKRELRAQLASGASDQAVLDFMAQRYGDFVLYRPPLKSQTWGLWFGPLLLLLLGAWILRGVLRQTRAGASVEDDDEKPREVRA